MYQTPDLNNQNSGTETSIIKNKSAKDWCKITIGKKKKWNIYSMSHSHLRTYFYGTLLFWTLLFSKILPPCTVLVTLPHCLRNRMLRIRLHIYEYGDHWKSDIENGLVVTAGEGECGTHGERSTEIYTLPCGKQTASGEMPDSTGSSARCPGTPRGAGWSQWERGDICILTADSQCWTAETNTILQSNYFPIKNKF